MKSEPGSVQALRKQWRSWSLALGLGVAAVTTGGCASTGGGEAFPMAIENQNLESVTVYQMPDRRRLGRIAPLHTDTLMVRNAASAGTQFTVCMDGMSALRQLCRTVSTAQDLEDWGRGELVVFPQRRLTTQFYVYP